jgi:hypothetical protein
MKFVSWLAAAIFAPFVVISAELWLTRHFNFGAPAAWDYAGLALSMITGLGCLWRLPVSKQKRVLLTIVFVPVGIFVLVFYSLFFVCVVFGDCL